VAAGTGAALGDAGRGERAALGDAVHTLRAGRRVAVAHRADAHRVDIRRAAAVLAGRVGDAGKQIEAARQMVAVVIQRIGAGLVARQHLARAIRRPLSAGAGLRAVLAGADVLGARRAVVARARLPVGAAGVARRIGRA